MKSISSAKPFTIKGGLKDNYLTLTFTNQAGAVAKMKYKAE